MTPRHTPAALADLAGPLRRGGLVGVGLGGLAAVVAALALPAWLVRLGAIRSPIWVVVAWLLAAGAGLAAYWAWRRVRADFETRQLASRLELSAGWRRGAVTSVLEGTTAGTSEDLYAAADRACAERVTALGPETLSPLEAQWAGRRRWAGGAAIVAGLLFIGASPLSGPASQLWSPAKAWATFIAPVDLTTDRTTVDRGGSVQLSLRAAGRVEAQLWIRGVGEQWRFERVALDSGGVKSRAFGPLLGDVFLFLASGGRTSDTVAVHVRIPAFLGNLSLTAKYPSYLRLEDEPLPTTGDTLLLPAGTRIEVVGETTADLATAGWTLGGATLPMTVTGKSFRGAVAPKASGLLALNLATVEGAPIGGDPIRLPVVVVADQPPVVDVPVPGQDTMVVLGNDLTMVVDVRDDHAITAVQVVAVLKRGTRQPAAAAIPLPPNTTDRALLSTKLDLTRFAMSPGDTVDYWVVARDNAPRGNIGRSKTFTLIVPTTTEARSEQRSETKQLGTKIDSLVASSKQLQRQTEDLSRERQRDAQDRGEQSLGFEEAKKAEKVAKDQQDLMDKAEAVRDKLEDLEKAADRGGIADSAFRQRLDEIRQQLDKALTPEMRKQLDELREALKNLDPQGTKDALKKLSEAQERLKEALERTRELFKRAALEGELASLQQEAKDVVKQQEEWNDHVGKADSNQAASEEQKLAERADSIAKGLEQASKQVDDERKEALKEPAQQAQDAAQTMKQAAKSAKAGKKQQAKKEGSDAAKQMAKVQKDVEEEKDQQQDEWRQEVLDALDRALAETARLSQRQLNLANTVGRGATLATSRLEQGVIEEGVQKVLEQVLAVSGKNALVSPQIGAALVQARLQMARAREAVSSASANLREASEQAGEAVDALNVAAYQMVRARDDVSGSSSGSGLAEAMKKMQQMAGKQGSMSQEGNNLLSMLANQQMSSGQLQALAQKQRQMAQELERLHAETQAQGTKELADEARELARKMEAGRLDRETVDRQERLFKRMLDAGRTLQGQEEDKKKEREATTAKTDSLSIPAPLRRLLDADGRIRLPSWEELQRLSPEERRLVTDYFRRLTSKQP